MKQNWQLESESDTEHTRFENVFEIEETVPSYQETEPEQESLDEPVPEPVPEPHPEPLSESKPKREPPKSKKKKAGKAGWWIALGTAVIFVGIMVVLFGGNAKSGSSKKAEKERGYYEAMVTACRDSIRAWGDFRGTVPSEALDLLSRIKKDELLYGQNAEGYDASAGLAEKLVEKMQAATDKWETAGDAQRPVNPLMARDCYGLALQLAQSVESVERDIFGLDAAAIQKRGRSRQIQSKIERLQESK